MKFLNEMKEIIPFDELEAILIEKGVYNPKVGKSGGRPQTPAKILLGTLFLQSWYSLSDPMTEELIHDRISFRKFLDIKNEDTIPDETTICKFRNKLIKKKLLSRIFDEVKAMMVKKNLILNEGILVDATLIHSSEPSEKKMIMVTLSPMKPMIKRLPIPQKEGRNIMVIKCILQPILMG